MNTFASQAHSELVSDSPELATNAFAQFDRVYTTPAGEQLLSQRPEAFDSFVASAEDLLGRKNYEDWRSRCIGTGKFATVYDLPDHEDLCMKVVSPRTMKGDHYGPFSSVRTPSLITDIRFMDLISRRLASRSEHGVFAPKYYAATSILTDEQGHAMLLDKIPPQFVPFRKFFKNYQKEETPESIALQKHMTGVLLERFNKALGYSALKLGINDFTAPGSRSQPKLNIGNVWLSPEMPVEETPVYVIDLIRGNGIKRPIARFLGKLAS